MEDRSNATPPPAPEAAEPLAEDPGRFDGYYSALASFVFHFCLVMLLPLLATVLKPEDKLPPAVEVVQVAETSSTAGETLDELPASDSPELLDQVQPGLPSDLLPQPELDAVAEPELTVPTDLSPEEMLQEIEQQAADAGRIAAATKAAVSQLDENLGGTPPTSGGGGGSGRAGRAARWILNFNTRSPDDYLQQMGLLEAEIAFPQQGNQYRYFMDLAGSRRSALRDLAQETRIYWIDDRGHQGVAQVLGVGSAPMMVAFLPESLEAKMLKLELAYQGVSSEDAILQTVFEAVRRGSGYDVIVVDQKLRSK